MRIQKKKEAPSRADSKVVSKALQFTNSYQDKDYGGDEWKVRQYKRLQVLPRQMPYFIDELGRVFARDRMEVVKNEAKWVAASAKSLRDYRDQLAGLLWEIVQYPQEPPDEAVQGVERPTHVNVLNKNILRLQFPVEGWWRSIVVGLGTDVTTQAFIPPTIGSFVAYASILLANEPWCLRLARCTICDKYFLNELGRRGPKRKVCSDQCNEKRSDPGAGDRARRSLQRRRGESGS